VLEYLQVDDDEVEEEGMDDKKVVAGDIDSYFAVVSLVDDLTVEVLLFLHFLLVPGPESRGHFDFSFCCLALLRVHLHRR